MGTLLFFGSARGVIQPTRRSVSRLCAILITYPALKVRHPTLYSRILDNFSPVFISFSNCNQVRIFTDIENHVFNDFFFIYFKLAMSPTLPSHLTADDLVSNPELICHNPPSEGMGFLRVRSFDILTSYYPCQTSARLMD